MSVELAATNHFLALTRFSGGIKHGPCIQFTQKVDAANRINVRWCGSGTATQGYEGLFTSVPIKDLPALIADLQAVVDGTIGEEP